MSIELTYLPVTGAELPVSKIFELGNEYTFEFITNARADKISMLIKDEDENVLYSTRLVYGTPLFHAVVEGLELNAELVAFNVADLLTEYSLDSIEVSPDTLGDTIQVYII